MSKSLASSNRLTRACPLRSFAGLVALASPPSISGAPANPPQGEAIGNLNMLAVLDYGMKTMRAVLISKDHKIFLTK